MSALGTISIKTKDGVYKNYTFSINDDTNEYGQNVKLYVEQTKEQIQQKAPRTYIGNGKIFWTDGKIFEADKVSRDNSSSVTQEADLPF